MSSALRRRLVLLLGLLLILPVPLVAQTEHLHDAASRIAKELKSVNPLLVAVVDFRPSDIALAPQAHYFAWLLSTMLETEAKKKFSVAEHRGFDQDLMRLHLTPETLMPGDALSAVASQIGADLLITGTLEKRDNSYFLEITPVRVSGSQSLAPVPAIIATNDFFESLFAPWPPDALRPKGRSAEGTTMPSCLHCPDPSYTDRARQAKINGVVVLEVLISPEGRARQMHLVKMLGYGLDEKAYDAIKGWKFRPATKDGSPVAVIVPIEVTFRIY